MQKSHEQSIKQEEQPAVAEIRAIELGDIDIATLIRFFELLDLWDRETNENAKNL